MKSRFYQYSRLSKGEDKHMEDLWNAIDLTLSRTVDSYNLNVHFFIRNCSGLSMFAPTGSHLSSCRPAAMEAMKRRARTLSAWAQARRSACTKASTWCSITQHAFHIVPAFGSNTGSTLPVSCCTTA